MEQVMVKGLQGGEFRVAQAPQLSGDQDTDEVADVAGGPRMWAARG